MANTEWQKVREIFDSALCRKPEERQRYIVAACGADKSLLAEVESLFDSLDSAESFLEKPAVAEIDGTIETEKRRLENGQSFGHYEIIETIGAGGMGEVYLAEDKTLDRMVAVKILNEKFSRDKSNLRRFVQEAKSASALNHPNILVIHEIGTSSDTHYIVSEYIKGKTLREVLKEKTLSLTEILDFCIQITAALCAAHEANLIHRDIKPENIMVRPDGYVKILDFGLAKLVERKNQTLFGADNAIAKQNQTTKGVILGTVNYMSPEQAKGERVDERTDIFSLGVLLYEMIAGQTPFAGSVMSETFANLINREPPPLSRFAANVPDKLQKIVSKTLFKNKDDRYQTMPEVLADLRELKGNLSFVEKLERTAAPDLSTAATIQAATDDLGNRAATTQRSFLQQISPPKPLAALLLITLLIGALWLGYRFYANRAGSANAGQIESIAVLPFQNQSGDANLDYLSDGLSESVIDRLSGLPQLKVIARNSSFKFRGKDDLQPAANALGVRAIVAGRVALNGENLSVRVELVDVRENRQLWSEQYNRRVSDAAVMQEEIALMILERLSLKLSGAQEQQIARNQSVNPQAFDLVLKARFYSYKGGAENWKKAVEYFEQAIAIDPNYASAYAGLFWTYRNLLTRGVLNPQEFAPKAAFTARKALELDPNLAEVHLALAYTKRDAWKWQEAEASYLRVLEINPNLASAHSTYAAFLSVTGRHDEAVTEARRAAALDPFSPLFATNTCFVLYLARRYDEAIEELKKTLELDRNNSNAHLLLGLSYTEKGMSAEAISAFQEAIRLDPISPNLQIFLGAAYARAGNRQQAQTILGQLQTRQGYISPADLAILYTALGEGEQAFASLEQAFSARDIQLQYLSVSPAYDSLRGDPRFEELVSRVGLKWNT